MDDPVLNDLQRLGVALMRASDAEAPSDLGAPRRPRRTFTLGVAVGAAALVAGLVAIRPNVGEQQSSGSVPSDPQAETFTTALAGSPRTPALTPAPAPSMPLGSWHPGSPPPFRLTGAVRAATTDDGRVIVLTGVPHADESAVEGGIYDPATDGWELIRPAPLHGGAEFRLVGDSLLALTVDAPPPQRAALLDLATRRWSDIEIPASVSDAPYPWTWDGETFVVLRTGPVGGLTGDSTPRTLRWSRSTGDWSDGAPPPFTPRSVVSSVVSPARIAIFGGFTSDLSAPGAVPTDPNADSQRAIDDAGTPLQAYFIDGAIYDVTNDSWTLIPPTPAGIDISSSGAAGAFVENDLYLVSGYHGGTGRDTVLLRNGVWSVLPTSAATGYMEESPSSLLVVGTVAQSGTFPIQYLDPEFNQWLDAPARTLMETGRGLVALTATTDNPGDISFGGSALVDGQWVPLVDAPFKNRMGPGIAVVGEKIVFIGGDEGPNLDRKSDVWILDLESPPS